MDNVRTGILQSKEYDPLFNNCYGKIMLLGYGGSHAYGTNIETSDIDIRGFYQNPADEILGIVPDKEQYVDGTTDTTIYSLKKQIRLLESCNPNAIELLGLRPQDYFFISPEAQMILDNKDIFLSKKAVNTFGGYAYAQLNRLTNKRGRAAEEVIANEARSMSKSVRHIQKKYHKDGMSIVIHEEENRLGVDISIRDMDINDVSRILEEINQVHTCYKRSTRNDKAESRGRIAKHMMHLIRLYVMAIDILNKHEVITYREDEHDLLMDIRNGKYLKEDGVTPTKDFETILNGYTRRFEEAKVNTTLPDEPDYRKINNLVIDINRRYLGNLNN